MTSLTSMPVSGTRPLTHAALKIHARDDAHAVATWTNVLIAVWRTETRAAALDGVSQALGELVAAHPEVALIQVVEAGATAPDAEARRAIAAMLRRYADSIRCSAVVFEGDGFQAATLRAVVTGIAILSRPSYPDVVFGSTVAAINWTARHFPGDITAFTDEARRRIGEFRQALDRPLSVQPGPDVARIREDVRHTSRAQGA